MDLAKSKKNNTVSANRNTNTSMSPAVIITICVAVAILVGVVIWSVVAKQANSLSNKTAMQIGDTKIDGLEYQFYYKSRISSFQNQYSSYPSYFGVDFTKDLSTQDYYNGMTWADYFSQGAQSDIIENTLMYNEAVSKGYELSKDEKDSVDVQLDTLGNSLRSLGYGVDYYLETIYGKGITSDAYKRIINKSTLASKYVNDLVSTYDYSEEDCEKYYNDNKQSYDTAAFRSFVFTYDVPDDAEEGDESYKDQARESADAMLGSITDEASFEKYVLDNVLSDEQKADLENDFTLTENVAYSTLNTAVSEWLFDGSRKEGDTTVVEANNGFNVLYFISCGLDKYNTVDIRHIFIAAEEEDHDDSEEGAHEAAAESALQEANKKANEIYSEWKGGDATAESFGNLATTYSSDSSATNGGLITRVYKNYFTIAEINDWIFDPSRAPGDSVIIDSDYGSHIFYFEAVNDPYWILSIKNTLANNAYNDYVDDLKTKVDIVINNDVVAEIAK